MRRVFAFSVVGALALAACAVGGGSEFDEGNEYNGDAGDPDGLGEGDAGVDAAGRSPDGGGHSDAADAGGDEGGAEPDGDADPPLNPCSDDQCFIADECVDAGEVSAADSCEVCLPTVNAIGWTEDSESPACDGKPYWDGVSHKFAVTPYGKKTAISCHNCYTLGSSNADSLSKTLAKIHDAQQKGADLIELDIKDEGGVIYVEHDDTGNTRGALFSDVISDIPLRGGTQLLFIESKEKDASEAYVRKVLEELKAKGWAKAGRPVVFRAFDGVSHNVTIARNLLATADFIEMRPHVRLHVLFSRGDGNDIAKLQTRIQGVKDKGFHGAEFEYQTPNLFGALKYAESLDLGTNIWTIPVSVGEVFVTTLRDETDALTVDYPIDKTRQVLEDKTGLIYLNAWKQTGTSVTWYRRNTLATTPTQLTVPNRPKLVDVAVGNSLFGGALTFDSSKQEHIPFYDAKNEPSDGYLVSTVVTFDSLVPKTSHTAVLIGKADQAAFSLEIHQPTSGTLTNTVLRFGVWIGDGYKYATYPVSKLQVGPSYMITGAYDGKGQVWMWVNNSAADTTKPPGEFVGGVKHNDSPVVLGADPQGQVDTQFYFDGKVQLAIVQNWPDH